MDNNINGTIEMPAPSIEYWGENENLIELKAFKEQYESMINHTKEQEELYKKICSKIEVLEKKEFINNNSNSKQFDKIEDFIPFISSLESIKDNIEKDITLVVKDELFLKKFIQVYLKSYNNRLFIDNNLVRFYESLVKLFNEKQYPYDEISSMLGIHKTDDVKKLSLNNSNTDKGFVNIIYVILSIVISCLIFVYLFFVNR